MLLDVLISHRHHLSAWQTKMFQVEMALDVLDRRVKDDDEKSTSFADLDDLLKVTGIARSRHFETLRLCLTFDKTCPLTNTRTSSSTYPLLPRCTTGSHYLSYK